MGIKVVYNACYGGYGLSDKAIEMLNGLSGGLVDRDMHHTLPRHDMNLVLVIEAWLRVAGGLKFEKRLWKLNVAV
jgi:hypothetical protein